MHFFYTPALDLTGYGPTKVEAEKSFDITLEQFIQYTANKKTIFDVLEDLGWTTNRKKKMIKAPDHNELEKYNPIYRKLLSDKGVGVVERNVELQLA